MADKEVERLKVETEMLKLTAAIAPITGGGSLKVSRLTGQHHTKGIPRHKIHTERVCENLQYASSGERASLSP